MRVKLNTIMAGPDGSHDAGSIVDLPDARARDLIARGFAVAVDPDHGPAPAPHPAPTPIKAEMPEAGETADLPAKPKVK